MDSFRYNIHVKDYKDPVEFGCVYLYRRTSGVRPHDADLIDYDPAGDGTAHSDSCLPAFGACGTITGQAGDYDGDGLLESPTYRMDSLGNWAYDKLYVGETGQSSGEDVLDLWKWRIDDPTEHEGYWDLRHGEDGGGGCAVWHGYIDGAVRVVRVIQGAASGGTTTKYEFAYPGEVHERVHLRVHPVGGPIYAYLDLHEPTVSGGATQAKVYTENSSGTYDEVDGSQPSSQSFAYKEWYQVSSTKGSFVVLPYRKMRFPTAGSTGGAYDDTDSALWDVGSEQPQDYDEEVGGEVGDKAAARWTVSDVGDSQELEKCLSVDEDKRVGVWGRDLIFLSAGTSQRSAGVNEQTRRDRGVFSVTAGEEERLPEPPPPPGNPCKPVAETQYGDDGGEVHVEADFGCSGVLGWNLYRSIGAGQYERLASLPSNAVYRDTTLELNEQVTYYATTLARGGAESEFSDGVTVHHIDTVSPDPPTNMEAEAGVGEIVVSWTPPSDPGLAGYTIKAATVTGGPYNVVAQGSQRLSDAVERTFSAAGVETYYVIVTLTDDAGNESLPSAEVSVEVP